MDASASLLEHNTRPDVSNVRALAYVASSFCCLFSASFTVFSLYTDVFEEQLHYTPLQLNYVSICAELGLYLCVPFFGYIADTWKLSYLGIVACVAYVLGYSGCAWVVMAEKSWPWMALSFGTVGMACSAGFISSLVNCARMFPRSALLAISLPTTLYGASSLMYAQLISAYLHNGENRVPKLYFTLSILLGLVGLIAAFAPIWGHVNTAADMEGNADSSNADNEGLAATTIPENYVVQFFRDRKILLLLLTFVFVSGPLEMYQNNIGLLVKAQTQGSTHQVASQVALFTGTSTAIRLVAGAVTDAFGVKPHVFLLSILAALAAADLAFAQHWIPLWLLSSISGIGYGSSFTLYPLIVSHIGGIKRFATYWGIFILGPAIGSFVFGVLFATNVQHEVGYGVTFEICAVAVLFSCFCISRIQTSLSF